MIPEQKFPIVVLEKGNRFHCCIRELFVFESGETLAAAYEKAKKKKQEILNQCEEAGIGELMPYAPPEKKRKWRYFSLNFLLFSLFLTVPIVSITHPLASILSRVSNLLKLKPIEFIIQLSEHAERMPLEKKKELKKAVKNLFAEYDRFVEVDSDSVPFKEPSL